MRSSTVVCMPAVKGLQLQAGREARLQTILMERRISCCTLKRAKILGSIWLI
jgi:hypothetical protein